ncbi:YbaB/EbfC family DNA-binding protein [Nonomuraea terrae]|uniref:YbaB/EbfC family DNA-binding protein n=1 Tax=Nonomuraea terrae TaxID=2530383 RepID=A0A4R4XIM5_9ACTN|nr:YbaB/EbfC family DNA-binding protein [Nonomuraea terrae]TDD30705.1 YbaB/EbfC family DNA-binding protein [Nonomuraea terrae]
MQEFGDFAKIDLEKLVKGADEQLALLGDFQERAASCVGRAQDENGFVAVEYGQEGVRELELHPKAMRLSSGELAELIKITLRDATEDFQRRLTEDAGELFGQESNPLRLLAEPGSITAKVKEAEPLYDQAFEDVMGRLDSIRRRLEL